MGAPRLATYAVSEVVTGPSGGGPSGENKAMVSLFNPGGSGKTIRLVRLMVQALSSSGTNVIVEYALRRITAHSAGTAVTPVQREQADDASIAEVKTEPTVTGGAPADNVFRWVFQSNTAQNPNSHEFHFVRADDEKPFVLAPGEGFVVHQVTNNGGNFIITPVWTEQ